MILIFWSSSKILYISLKLSKGSNLWRKGSILYPNRNIGNLEVNEFTAGIMKSAEKMEQLLGRVITTCGGMTILFPILPGNLHSVGFCSTTANMY